MKVKMRVLEMWKVEGERWERGRVIKRVTRM